MYSMGPTVTRTVRPALPAEAGVIVGEGCFTVHKFLPAAAPFSAVLYAGWRANLVAALGAGYVQHEEYCKRWLDHGHQG